jgi:glycosyltransferase involved in cell wall biosynthesis
VFTALLAAGLMGLLAGRWGDRHEFVRERVRALGLADRVHFTGAVSDVAGLLSAADLGAFSSRSEGLPNGVLECMAAGLAVCATAHPGVREAVGAEGEALLAPPGDSHALADRILRAALDADLRRRLGEHGRTRVAAEFAPERMYELMVDLIRRALGRRAPDGAGAAP